MLGIPILALDALSYVLDEITKLQAVALHLSNEYK